MSETEHECWICRRTETELKELFSGLGEGSNYAEAVEMNPWLKTERAAIEACPICQEVLDDFRVKDVISADRRIVIREVIDEFMHEFFDKLKTMLP